MAFLYAVASGKVDGDTSLFQGGRKGPKQQLSKGDFEERKRHWQTFQEYLERRCSQQRLDVVIDGANVGYFEQNFQGAPKHVDYNQIDWIVQHFLRENKSGTLFLASSQSHAPLRSISNDNSPQSCWCFIAVIFQAI
jgi:ribonuclease P protein 3